MPNEDLPGLRPASSRKRKETSRFIENGDLPPPKKKRVPVNKPTSKSTEPPTHSTSPSTRKSTVDLEDHGGNDESNATEHLPESSPESVDKIDEARTLSSDDDDEEEVPDEDEVVEVEESAGLELSKHITGINHHY